MFRPLRVRPARCPTSLQYSGQQIIAAVCDGIGGGAAGGLYVDMPLPAMCGIISDCLVTACPSTACINLCVLAVLGGCFAVTIPCPAVLRRMPSRVRRVGRLPLFSTHACISICIEMPRQRSPQMVTQRHTCVSNTM